MAVLNFPTLTPSAAEFGLVTNTHAFTSDFSGAAQTIEKPGAHWRLKLVFLSLNEANAAAMRAFLVKLGGAAGRFYYADPQHMISGPRGVKGATPVCSSGSQTGKSLSTAGWTASASKVLRAGDYIQLHDGSTRELKMVTDDVDADASGSATIEFAPEIRRSPADRSRIKIEGAMGVFRLMDDEQAAWSQSVGKRADFTLHAIEAFA